MTQTAVEWLVEQFKDYDCTPASNTEEYVIVMPQWIFNAKRDEALEMEKAQLQAADANGANRVQYYKDMQFGGAEYWEDDNLPQSFEHYYNQKFKK